MRSSHSFIHSIHNLFTIYSAYKGFAAKQSELTSIHCPSVGCVILNTHLTFLSLFCHVKSKASDTTLHGYCED